MANPVFEAVRTVLAVREFADREVPDEVVHQMVEALRLSASSQNQQPWHFVVVRDRQRLRELAPMMKTGPYIAEAAGAIVVAVKRDSHFGLSDASRAIQSMILVAWAAGVGTNWVGFGDEAERHDEARRFVALSDEYQVVAVIPYGYPRRRIGLGKKNRRPVGEVASAERFGSPFS